MNLSPLINQEGLSLTEKVYLSLKQDILSMDIKPGEYLIIGDIAKYYKLSRTPVREAIIMLENEGWVIQDKRRGAKVVAPSAKSIMDMLELQMVLEGYVAYRAAELITDDDVLHLEKLLNTSEKYFSQGDYEQSRTVGDSFHKYIAKLLGNNRIQATIEQIQAHVDRVRPLIWHAGVAPLEESTKQHREILNAIKERDPIKAQKLMQRHTIWFEEILEPTLRNLLG